VKTYRGIREPLCHVRVFDSPGAADGVAPRGRADGAGGRVLAVPKELVSQVLAPLDWGNEGPGSHYLAVALLADLLGAGDRAGIKAALPFMRRFLSRLPKDDFEIAETIFRAMVETVVPAAANALAPPGKVDGGSGAAVQREGAPRREGLRG
jgi:hypothetical protein